MRISDWSSDVCSSDLRRWHPRQRRRGGRSRHAPRRGAYRYCDRGWRLRVPSALPETRRPPPGSAERAANLRADTRGRGGDMGCRADRRPRLSTLAPCHGQSRSEEHTSELQSLMRISYAVFCLKKKKIDYKLTIFTSNLYSSQL